MISPIIELNSAQPIYQQIVDFIIQHIDNGQLTMGDDLPSINRVAQDNKISRDTVMMAYNDLKQHGIIKAIPGKGYYIKSTNTHLQKNIFLLFDELNSFKEDLYQSFVATIPSHFNVDLFFHHFNIKVFEKLIADNKTSYHKYIIMPSNMPATGIHIDNLPSERVILIDQPAQGTIYNYPIIYQSFDEDLYNGLQIAEERIRQYKRLILLFPGGKEPIGFKEGFERFCSHSQMQYKVSSALVADDIHEGDLYLCINNRDLIELIKYTRRMNYQPGQQIGIISINDSALLEIIEGGITAISTDFKEMGRNLAKMVVHNLSIRIKNPSRLIMRNSL